MYSNCATAIRCTPLLRVQAESGVQWTPLEAEGVLIGRGTVAVERVGGSVVDQSGGYKVVLMCS